MKKLLTSCCMLISCVFFISIARALPFDVVPQSTLPTSILVGQSLTVQYTVTNNTASIRTGNFVAYLPPHVTQITNNDPTTCGVTFDLAPRGQSGDHCTLILNVSGAVNAANTDPHQHLFVCFPGKKTCAGTPYPLNVSVQHLAYIANRTNQTAGFGSISICEVSDQDGHLYNCINDTDTTGNETSSIILNKNYTQAYLANSCNNPCTSATGNTITRCALAHDGRIGTNHCVTAVTSTALYGPEGLAFNAEQTLIYAANESAATAPGSTTPSAIAQCSLTDNGSISGCVAMNYPTSPVIWNPPYLQLNAAGQNLYITNLRGSTPPSTVAGTGNILLCSITSPLTCNIANTDAPIIYPVGIALNHKQTYAYLTTGDSGNDVDFLICRLDAQGLLNSPCVSFASQFSPALTDPQNVVINDLDTTLYIANRSTNIIYSCSISDDGARVTNCIANTGNGTFFTPQSIAYR